MDIKEAKKTFLYASITTVLAIIAPMAAAVEVGLGVSINNSNDGGLGGYGIAVPLRFSNFTIEPELSFYRYSADSSNPSSPTNSYDYENTQITLESGIYWRQQIVPSVEAYVGGRLGYTKVDYSYIYPASPANNQVGDESGFYLGPTVGAEYFFNKHFSLGLDVSMLLESRSGDSISGASTSASYDRDNIYYQSRARLRFYY